MVCEALGRHTLFARMGIFPGPPNLVRADKAVVSPSRLDRTSFDEDG